MIKWIIEELDKENGDFELAELAKKSGCDVSFIKKVNEFNVSNYYSKIKFPCRIIFKGSIDLARQIYFAHPEIRDIFFPNPVWLNDRQLDCSYYFSYLGNYLLNSYYSILTVKELIRLKWEVYREFAIDTKIFVRPCSCYKTFTGQLLDLKDFDVFWNNENICDVTEHDLIVISSPKEIRGEWRFVISYQEVVAYSTYLYQGNRTLIPSAPNGAIELAKDISNNNLFTEYPLYVIDIAEDSFGNFKLLEINSFSTAALYACSKDKIVNFLNKNFKI